MQAPYLMRGPPPNPADTFRCTRLSRGRLRSFVGRSFLRVSDIAPSLLKGLCPRYEGKPTGGALVLGGLGLGEE